ncbi:MAG: FtsK/SpoIIIE domain-containing protein [Candidatus Dormibacteria bacterium]
MELWLVVDAPGGVTADVAVRAPGGLTNDGLAEAFTVQLGLGPAGPGLRWGLYAHRQQTWLAAAGDVARAGLLHGDTVALRAIPAAGRDEAAAQNAEATLTVTSGPQAGLVVRVGVGVHFIGRGTEEAVQLSDPFVSARHARLDFDDQSATLTVLPGQQARVDGRPVAGTQPLRSGQVLTVGASELLLGLPAGGNLSGGSTGAGEASAEVIFNRPPRVVGSAAALTRRLGPPPTEPRPPRLPIAAAVLPLLLGGVIYAFARSPLTLVFLAMSPLLAIGSYVEGRFGARGDHRRAAADFRAQVAEVCEELAVAIEVEVRERREAAPTLRTVARAAHARESRLWQRRPSDEDFLRLRLATGTLPSRHLAEVAPGGSAVLRAEAEARLEGWRAVAGVPLALNLAELGTVGLAGPRECVLDLGRWLLVQVATLHSPGHVSIMGALPPAEVAEWDWLKWLPHVRTPLQDLEGPRIVADSAAARELLERMLGLVDARAAEVGPFRGAGGTAPFPHIVLLLHEDLPLSRPAVVRLLTEGPRLGVVTIWIGSSARHLPNECQAVVEVDAARGVNLTVPGSGTLTHGAGAEDRATTAEARQVALELAPLRDASAEDAAGRVPAAVGLLDLLGLPRRPQEVHVRDRWRAAGPALAAPIGVSAQGTFSLDLDADGPHALVGGTTGSGKSELLQTLVGSLAASQPPSRLNFLLVDYKGGAAFSGAVRLPHTVGMVTDLDGRLARRALVSLGAELRRREAMLREHGARDLREFAERDPAHAPPRLLIVVDEFATLAREVPEFVDGVVDLAQRGRSLGLHLLLATQRPAGVINDSIRANTSLRVALRVSDDAESVDVVGVPDAARIARSRPGRALVRRGHGELTEVQVAYAGAAEADPHNEAEAAVVVPLGIGGALFPRTAPRLPAKDTDLERLVSAVCEAHDVAGLPPPRRPWLPELPDVLPVRDLPAVPGAAVPMGLLDLPGQQAQEPWIVDLKRSGNLLIFGTAGSGKTTLLTTLAGGLASALRPHALHLYALDCAGGGLGGLQVLPHCGAYIRVDETQRAVRLLRWLRRLVNDRRAASGDGGGEAAMVVVVLDDYGGFLGALEKVEFGEHVDAMPRLVADGPAVGVHFAISAARRGAVPSALSAVVEDRVVLRLADEDEYRNAGLAAEVTRAARWPAGRAFVRGAIEAQCAVLDDGALPALAAELGPAPGPHGPVGIELLPDHVAALDLPPPSSPWQAIIGVEDGTLGPAVVDLAEDSQLLAGPPHSGRSTALLAIVNSLRRGEQGSPTAYLLAPRRSPLLQQGHWSACASGLAQCEELAAQLAHEVRRGAGPPAGARVVVVIDDGEELTEGASAADLQVVARHGRDMGFRVVAAIETRAAHRAYSGWVAELKKARRGVILQPDADIDGDLFGVRLPRIESGAFPPGRGYLVRPGATELVQVVDSPATSGE